jgi:biopolymer transport protein ExbB/TolQ
MIMKLVSRGLFLVTLSLLVATTVAQENIKPCECIPCGGQVQCTRGSTSWCECRSDKCFGGCLPPDRNPRRLAAAVVTIITDEEVDLPPESLQEDPQRFAGILGKLLEGKIAEGTYSIEYEDRKIGFVFTPAALTQLIEVETELKAVLPSASPTPSPTPTPSPSETSSQSQQEPESQTGFSEIMTRGGWLGSIEFVILMILLIYSIIIAYERFTTFSNSRRESQEFASRIANAFRQGLPEAIKLSRNYSHSHLGLVVNSGLEGFSAYDELSEIAVEEFDFARHAIQRTIAIKTVQLKRGLSSLAAISTIAPQIGLLGLTIGLMNAFHSATTTGSIYSFDVINQILVGLSLLGLGIGTGIFARWFKNYVNSKVKSFILEMTNGASELEQVFPSISTQVAKSNIA